jgi:type IV secretory pathway VirB2 component (pilin)
MRLARTPGCRFIGTIGALITSAVPLMAQASPWENAVNVLQISFTGPIARGLSLVAIVVGGLLFAFGEGQSKRAMTAGAAGRRVLRPAGGGCCPT